MKKITSKSVLSVDKYYGIEETERPLKGFLVRKEYRHPLGYKVMCVDNITEGNSFPFLYSETLEEFKRKIIKEDPLFVAYEFQTSKELFEWLAK